MRALDVTVAAADGKRLCWRCRRGTRELDLLLSRYLENDYDRARPEERAAFEKLLELPDPELYRLLITGKEHAGGDCAGARARVVRCIARGGARRIAGSGTLA